MALTIGSKAPEFTLIDTDRNERSLNQFLSKKTVLVFYPGAFTGVCTSEVCALRDAMTNFNSLDAHVIGISGDGPFANKAFADTNKLNFTLLSDITLDVTRKYAGVYADFAGVKGYTAAKRSVFVLDRNGVVKYAWVTENPGTEPPYDEIKKALGTIS